MEIIITVENFEDGGVVREINSPRTLEACLRSGLDPKELAPRPRSTFTSKTLTKEMLDAKFKAFENKRKGASRSMNLRKPPTHYSQTQFRNHHCC